jgi:uncharacterized cupredoxin-like copper-binding protein
MRAYAILTAMMTAAAVGSISDQHAAAQSMHQHHMGTPSSSSAPLPPPVLSAPRTQPSGHDHAARFAAGRPGDPKKPARQIDIEMREAAGKMVFTPDRIEVHRNEQVRFRIQNHGELDHEFMLVSAVESAAHQRMMEQHPDMAHDEPNGRKLAPGKTVELLWMFDKSGTYEFTCLIPGHREAGMTGSVTVKK